MFVPFTRSCESTNVFCATSCSLNDRHSTNDIRAVHDRIRAFFCEICKKSFKLAHHLRTHEKTKQHQLRLLNGGGDDVDFFNNGQRRQNRQLTISTSSTSSTTTVAKRFQCNRCTKSFNRKEHLQVHVDAVHLLIRHWCNNCGKSFSQQSGLSLHLRRVCNRKPFKCDRCPKRFPCYDWLAEHKVWHIQTDFDRYFKWFDLYAYPCFYCSHYFTSTAEAFEHIRSAHVRPHHTLRIKEEESSSSSS